MKVISNYSAKVCGRIVADFQGHSRTYANSKKSASVAEFYGLSRTLADFREKGFYQHKILNYFFSLKIIVKIAFGEVVLVFQNFN